jgi:galactokinase
MTVNLTIYETEERYEEELAANVQECKAEFARLFNENEAGRRSLVCVAAPGRVNLIGEHTDYNDGFVFPMAIPLYTVMVGAVNESATRTCRVRSLEPSLGKNNTIEFSLDSLAVVQERPFHWANYIIGVAAYFDGEAKSFDAVIKSNVPLGSGLSSSAALQISAYTFIENVSNREFFIFLIINSIAIFSNKILASNQIDFSADKLKKAVACQRAEQDYANLHGGIMDQFVSIMGEKGSALLIDCRSLTARLYPLSDSEHVILAVNSNVKHELEGSEYAVRRQTCEKVAAALGKASLRDLTMHDLHSI